MQLLQLSCRAHAYEPIGAFAGGVRLGVHVSLLGRTSPYLRKCFLHNNQANLR
jgi:hypothetical protein